MDGLFSPVSDTSTSSFSSSSAAQWPEGLPVSPRSDREYRKIRTLILSSSFKSGPWKLLQDLVLACELALDVTETLVGISEHKLEALDSSTARIQSLLIEDAYEIHRLREQPDLAGAMTSMQATLKQVCAKLEQVRDASWSLWPHKWRFRMVQKGVLRLESEAVKMAQALIEAKAEEAVLRYHQTPLPIRPATPEQPIPLESVDDDWDEILPWQPSPLIPTFNSGSMSPESNADLGEPAMAMMDTSSFLPSSFNSARIDREPRGTDLLKFFSLPTSECRQTAPSRGGSASRAEDADYIQSTAATVDFSSLMIPAEFYPRPVVTAGLKVQVFA